MLESPLQYQEFKLLSGITILYRENATQSNTGYAIIQSIIRNRDHVEVFCQCHCDYLDSDCLSGNDWAQLVDAVSILEPFHAAR